MSWILWFIASIYAILFVIEFVLIMRDRFPWLRRWRN